MSYRVYDGAVCERAASGILKRTGVASSCSGDCAVVQCNTNNSSSTNSSSSSSSSICLEGVVSKHDGAAQQRGATRRGLQER
eukprot:19183-Heterococcus_DN1.PRE.8